jgi:hypothetical protein
MEQFILWCAFLGAWLLFAGPILQAALELREQELSREEFEAANALVEREPPVSAWWWLLPPVYYWLNHRRSDRMNKAMMKLLTPQQMSGLIDYVNKATGWLFVGVGGLLIAIKETWLLSEHNDWPLAAYWTLVVFMIVVSVGNAVARIAWRRRVTASDAPPNDG